jgi:hypothetical protein
MPGQKCGRALEKKKKKKKKNCATAYAAQEKDAYRMSGSTPIVFTADKERRVIACKTGILVVIDKERCTELWQSC